MKELRLSDILKDFSKGITRKEFMSKYNLSTTEVKQLMEEPSLKGCKFKRKAKSFVLIDDTLDNSEETYQEVMLEKIKLDDEIVNLHKEAFIDRFSITTDNSYNGNI